MGFASSVRFDCACAVGARDRMAPAAVAPRPAMKRRRSRTKNLFAMRRVWTISSLLYRPAWMVAKRCHFFAADGQAHAISPSARGIAA